MSEDHPVTPQPKPQLLIRPLAVLEGHDDALRVIRFSPNGRDFVSIDDNIFCLWREEQPGKWTLQKQAEESFLTFCPDDTLLLHPKVAGSQKDHFQVYSQQGALLRSFEREKLPGPRGYHYTPDGQWFFTADCEGHLSLWDRELTHLHASLPLFNDDQQVDCPYGLCFSPENRYVFFESNSFIYRCELDLSLSTTLSVTRIGRKRFTEQFGPFESFALSPLGHLMAASNGDINQVDLYDIKSLSLVAALPLPLEELPCDLAFSPNGRLLACAGSNGTVYIWDTQTSELITTFIAHPDVGTEQSYAIGCIAWSSRGDLLVTGGASFFLTKKGNDYSVRVWEVTEM